MLLVTACGSAASSEESVVLPPASLQGQSTSIPLEPNGMGGSASSVLNQGGPNNPSFGTQGSIGAGGLPSSSTVRDGRPPEQTGPIAPTSTLVTQSFTPFACVARLMSTLDRVPTGKRPIKLRVVATEGKPRNGWWRLRYGRETMSGSITFDTTGSAETSTLLVDAGSKVFAEVFASSQYLPTSISCEAQTVVAP